MEYEGLERVGNESAQPELLLPSSTSEQYRFDLEIRGAGDHQAHNASPPSDSANEIKATQSTMVVRHLAAACSSWMRVLS